MLLDSQARSQITAQLVEQQADIWPVKPASRRSIL